MDEAVKQQFLEALWGYYAKHARNDLPWRTAEADGSFDPYKILVSEIMLQQTQVARVIPKYQNFLAVFPTVETLAKAELGEVLKAWQGLGYNRRAKFLWLAAGQIITDGIFPSTLNSLVALPGVGKHTAGAIMAYAYNKPERFIETNVRTVYIHHFAQDHQNVSDDFIWDLLEQTIDHEHPREFYWAVMDYGSHLKATVGNNTKQSQTYAKQSRFIGSLRQIRGQVIRELSRAPKTASELRRSIRDERLEEVLKALLQEGLIRKQGAKYSL